MRKLFVIILALFACASVSAQITVPQSVAWGHCTASPCTLSAFGTQPSAGSAIIVAVSDYGASSATGMSVAENSVTYTQIATAYDSGSNRATGIFCRPNIPGGQTIAPVITHGSTSEVNGSAIEVAGLSACTVDQTGTLNPLAHWGTSGTDTVAAAGANGNATELAFSVIGGRSSVTFSAIAAPSGWNAVQYQTGNGTGTNSPAASAYKITTGVETSSASWVGTNNGNSWNTAGNALIATFLPVGSGSTGTNGWFF